eukprot:g32456.t1
MSESRDPVVVAGRPTVAEVAATVAEARETALDARLRLTWRGTAPGVEAIRQELADFELLSMEVGESAAIVQLGSREMALRAVLECKSRKNLMPFKVALAPKETVEVPVNGQARRGLAGVSAANTVLECGGKVVLVDKSAFCGGNSTKATSGINGAETQTQKQKKDSVQLFTSDTLKGGAKKPELVKVLCGNSGS